VPPAELQALAGAAEQELRGDILPFWLAHARDDRGGFQGLVEDDLTVRPKAPRGALLTSRILWTFSAAYRQQAKPEYLAMAQAAYRDLARFRDPEAGGLFWSLRADGRPLDTHKQIYGQAFGVYALAEYHRATGDQAALQESIALYRLIEAKARDRVNGGYFDEFSRTWGAPDRKHRSVLGGPNAPKSQNTLLHLLEAYTALARVWPDPGLHRALHDLLSVMLDRVVNPATHHLMLYQDAAWTPLVTDISFGHDIEFSWLAVEAAEVLGEPELLARVRAEAVAVARVTLAQGVDADGGVCNEAGPQGLTDTRKDWWPQAEACVGFLNAYQLTGDRQWFDAARHTWGFIQAKVVDHERGEWRQSVARDGSYTPQPKLNFWKCPYHNSRACLELMERLESLAKASEGGGR